MNIVKVSAEKVYGGATGMYGVTAMAHVEMSGYDEKTVVLVTDGAEKMFGVYDEYIDEVGGEEPVATFDSEEEANASEYAEAFKALLKAAKLVDD